MLVVVGAFEHVASLALDAKRVLGLQRREHVIKPAPTQLKASDVGRARAPVERVRRCQTDSPGARSRSHLTCPREARSEPGESQVDRHDEPEPGGQANAHAETVLEEDQGGP